MIQTRDKSFANTVYEITKPQESKELRPFVTSRDDLPTLSHVEKNGELFNLGILKDFRKADRIRNFLPDLARISLSWVSLKPNEKLEIHEHPIQSMIIITAGEVEITGDTNKIIGEGDIICIPPHRKHGFIGRGENGFWGLSIQFEHQGLYEDAQNALVKFDRQSTFDKKLLQRQEEWKTCIRTHSLFKFVRELQNKTIFLRIFMNWSNEFQRLVLLRSAMVSNSKFVNVTDQHLFEEFGHNKLFDHLIPAEPSLSMEAICCWFRQKMLQSDDQHRLILMNLAIEGSATIFYSELYDTFLNTDESKHFRDHNELDHTHEGMGLSLLKIDTKCDYDDLLITLDKTWSAISELYTVMENDCKQLLEMTG